MRCSAKVENILHLILPFRADFLMEAKLFLLSHVARFLVWLRFQINSHLKSKRVRKLTLCTRELLICCITEIYPMFKRGGCKL